MFKKRFEAMFMIVVLVAVLVGGYYAITQAIGINRTYGSNAIAGFGLRQGTNDPDTFFVKVNVAGGIGDSVMQLLVTDSTKALKVIGAGARVWGGMNLGSNVAVVQNRLYVNDTIRCTMGLFYTGTAGGLSLPNDAITNTMTAAIESTWITDGSIGHASIKDGGVYGSDIANGYVIRTAHVLNSAAMYDSVVFTAGAGIDISQGANNLITITNTSTGGGAWWGQHVNGSAISTDTMVYLAENGIILRQVVASGQQDTIGIKADTTTLKSQLAVTFMNDGGGEINATGDFNFTSAVKITNLVADSVAEIWFEPSVINWSSKPFEPAMFSIGEGVDDNISIYYPLRCQGANSDTVFEWCAKHTTNGSSGDDQYDTVCFSGMVGYVKDSVTIDSLTFNIKTSSNSNSVTSVKALVIRHTKGSGTFSDMKIKSIVVGDTTGQLVSTTANGWSHKRFPSLTTKAITGDRLAVWFQIRLDASQTVIHDNPVLWFRYDN